MYICGHADSLDVCSLQLIGQSPGTKQELVTKVTSVQFCSILSVEEEIKGKWKIVKLPIPSITHGVNHKFDHTILHSK